MKKQIITTAVLVTTFLAGMLAYHLWQIYYEQTPIKNKATVNKVLYWVAPMDPSYRRDKPGKSPMGMDLVPVYANQTKTDSNTVRISPTVENNIGVKSSIVKKRNLARIIDTVGFVSVDENNIAHIHTRTDGWVRKLNVKTTGEYVKKGQLLLELYSPTLNNAQEELLLALKMHNSALIKAGEKKLATLGMSVSQINRLQKSKKMMDRVNVYATRSGNISLLNVREGKFVKPDTDLMTIEDLSQIWIIAEVFERQANWVKKNQVAIASVSHLPGKVWEGRIDYVYPNLDYKTHTLRVRLKFPNPDLTLKPQMYTNIKILSQTIPNTLSIPQSALIRTGQGDRVVISLGNGKYKAVPVEVGIASDNYYQVLSGLKEGEKVVTSAQFLIDSESNLAAAFSRMQHDDHSSKTHALNQFVGEGTVQKVDRVKHEILIKHKPIPSLHMHMMVMRLQVDKRINLSTINVGNSVHFIIKKQHNNQFLLTKIRLMKEKTA